MELVIGETQLKCYENGCIERIDKRNKKWTEVKGNSNARYLQIGIENKIYKFHRIIYKAFHPEFDLNSPLQIDHINRDKKDNRIENLRIVTHQQNLFNTNAKGYYCHHNGFEGQIRINGKILTKYFATEEEARTWYLQQKALHHLID
jgi:hypothetical protein